LSRWNKLGERTDFVLNTICAQCEQLKERRDSRGDKSREEDDLLVAECITQVPARQSKRLAAQAGNFPQALSQNFEGLGIGQSRQWRHGAAQPQQTPQQAPQPPQPQPQSPRTPRNVVKGWMSKVKPSKKKDDHKPMTPGPQSREDDDDDDDDDPTPRPKKLSFRPTRI
jgi:hypothetical protein